MLVDVRLSAALCGLQRSNLRLDCRSALEWEKPYSKLTFGEVYHLIYICKPRFTTPLARRRKTKFPTVYLKLYRSPNENFEYSNTRNNKQRFTLNTLLIFSEKLGIK